MTERRPTLCVVAGPKGSGKTVSHYTIIEDESDMLPEQQSYFVQTNPQFGIKKKDIEKSINILRQSI